MFKIINFCRVGSKSLSCPIVSFSIDFVVSQNFSFYHLKVKRFVDCELNAEGTCLTACEMISSSSSSLIEIDFSKL